MEKMNERQKSKLIYKVASVAIITLVQAVSFILATEIYLFLSPPNPKYDLGLELSLYFFSFYLFPLAIFIGNLITMFTNKRIFILSFFIIGLALLIYYWVDFMYSYPFKSGYIMCITFVLAVLGLFSISRIRDWIS